MLRDQAAILPAGPCGVMVKKPPLTLNRVLQDLNNIAQDAPGEYVEAEEVMLYVEGDLQDPEERDNEIVEMFDTLSSHFMGFVGTLNRVDEERSKAEEDPSHLFNRVSA